MISIEFRHLSLDGKIAVLIFNKTSNLLGGTFQCSGGGGGESSPDSITVYYSLIRPYKRQWYSSKVVSVPHYWVAQKVMFEKSLIHGDRYEQDKSNLMHTWFSSEFVLTRILCIIHRQLVKQDLVVTTGNWKLASYF